MDPSSGPGLWAPLPRQPKQARCYQKLAHTDARRTFFWTLESKGPICQECVNARSMKAAIEESLAIGNPGNNPAHGKSGKPGRSTKAPVVIGAVLARRANGQNKAQIARDLKMSTNTVSKILDESEFDAQIAEGRRASHGLIPKAVKAMELQLDKGNGVLGRDLLRDLNVIGENASKSGRSDNCFGALSVQINNLIHGGPPTAHVAQVQAETITIDAPVSAVEDSHQVDQV